MLDNISNETASFSYYGRMSPVECYKLNMIAVYCIVLFILSVLFNFSLVLIFARYKEMRTNLNMFVFTLTILNLIGTISELSLVIPSNMYCK